MTVSSTNNRMSYPGTGSTGPFTFTFKVFDESHLLVTKADDDGDETTLVLNTDYAVEVDGNNGGSVTLTDALESGETLVIRRVLPLTQETDLRNQGEYLAETVEDAEDRAVMIAQQQQDEINRSVRLSETTDPNSVSPILPTPAAGKFISWNDSADGFVNADATDLLTAAGGSNWMRDTFDGDGIETEFALSALPGVENNTQVYVNGVYQSKDTYSLSSLTLTFDSAPGVGTGNVEVVYNQIYEIGVPADNSVGTDALQADAVSNAKLANAAALTIKGNATNASANPADIALGTDGFGLFREGTTLEGRLVAAKNLADEAVTMAKLAANLISTMTEETTPAADDLLMVSDTSAAALRAFTLTNLLKVINSLIADGSPDTAADYVVTYDASAGTVKKVLISNLVTATANATTSAAGIIELATSSEVTAGSDGSRAVVPSTIVSHQGVCKGWAYFEQNGTHSLLDSYNVTSVSDTGVGATTVTWATNFANANYAVTATADGGFCEIEQSSKATGSCIVLVKNAAGTAIDSSGVCVMAFGDR